MAQTNSWDSTIPADTGREPRLGAGDIRNDKLSTKERMQAGDHYWEEGNDDSNGYHYCAGGSKVFRVWNFARDTVLLDVDETNLDCTLDSSMTGGFVGMNVTTGDNPGHGHDVAGAFQLDVGATGVVDGLYFENIAQGDVEIIGAKLVAAVAPDSGDLEVDVLRVANGYSDPGASGTTIFDAGNPKILNAAKVGVEITSFDAAESTLAQGDAIYFSIVSTGGATSGVVLYLELRRD